VGPGALSSVNLPSTLSAVVILLVEGGTVVALNFRKRNSSLEMDLAVLFAGSRASLKGVAVL
jgi:hypothetical protein